MIQQIIRSNRKRSALQGVIPLIVFAFLSDITHLTGQHNLRKLGFSLGASFIDEQLPEGVDYTPFMVMVNSTLWRFKDLGITGELQLVKVLESLDRSSNVEFGTNFGLQYTPKVSKSAYLLAGVTAGPHFITINTDLQTRGFIFSDNFEVGIRIKMPSSKWHTDLKVRYRHISNAGIQNPNGGIDNFFVIIGFGGQ